MVSYSMTERDPKTAVRSLQSVYRTGETVPLSTAFFGPCLRHATKYRRAAGYFSSTALRSWGGALSRIVADELSIQLLISPELSEEDSRAFQAAIDERRRREVLELASDRLMADALEILSASGSTDARIRFLTWMIAAGRIEIRFAVPRHTKDAGIFHEKSGIFEFSWGDRVAFSGSPNETEFGYVRNYERLDAFRSWIAADQDRLDATLDDFERQWAGRDEALVVAPLSEKSLSLIRERAPRERPDTEVKPEANHRWRHQQEAVEAFLKSGRGIFEMATGTGKTRTALMAIEELLRQGKISGVIVTTEGTDLLSQWFTTLVISDVVRQGGMRVLRQFEQHHQAASFANDPTKGILVISRQQFSSLVPQLRQDMMKNMMIVHDEVHGLGAPLCLKSLLGIHRQFGYTLGLSATPEREYDQEGTDFIEQEIGPVIYRFGLPEAIERGILVEFDYVPLEYELTNEDKKRLSVVHRKKAAREKEGQPMSREEVWTELSRVYKTAEQKPAVFADYLADHPQILKNAILFVEERWYGDQLLPVLDRYTHLYRTYYAEHDQSHLLEFGQGAIDCLITCHRISQGIDIRRLRTVVLFSSARARLETIQRIGRCLRSDPDDPGKRALVIDFVRHDDGSSPFESADSERREWLTDLARIRRKE